MSNKFRANRITLNEIEVTVTGNNLYIGGSLLSNSDNVESTGTLLQNQIDNISVTSLINHNFFFDYPFSGLNAAESYIQEDFTITGIVMGVNITGNADSIGCEFYQRLSDGTTKIPLTNEILETGSYHKLTSQPDLLVTGMNRLVIDLTGVVTGFEGLSVGVLGYR